MFTGYLSYVRPISGSVYINTLVETFSMSSGAEHITDLLTMVKIVIHNLTN